ncbi:hypothetical protein BGL34_02040 [Fructilactobacillus lindneri]|uniref:Uncharacterized protein n=1 Tax=Fructilactobacillus lindneri TaxID=53444 RepID=A0AB33BIL5_9LACO|nr:hypothetical protein [Fructilactobacillus lindneri]ANZ58052.1 hypothetical protein AYR60_04545 [Fructilactobacillus lindneri]ANZ59373.1 hypothetical protein AYR59_04800 [Fructilactobacillus lindneri]POG98843.1 hypothetical protein BGL31_02630 [Fructilactobacillus lindneri]POH03116.1 hypothetical protein BGL33_04065 [Fructilactobacillus lindneri]POH04231.1 hypothetical protein BGL32_02570 [Fructilactobacillus lindneri]
MINIKLNEFKVSSADLNHKNLLFFEFAEKIKPITNIKINSDKIILISQKDKNSLNLQEFIAITKDINENHSFFIENPHITKIFGYRINKNRIIFG